MKKKILYISNIIVIALLLTGCISRIKYKSENERLFHFEDNETFNELGNEKMMPTTGNVRALVFLIDFSDYPSTSQNMTRDDISKAFFGEKSDTTWESLSSFYRKSSFDQLNITGDVYGWHRAGNVSSYYGTSENTNDNLFYQILNAYNPIINYADYDSNGDGTIDALYFLYTRPANSSTNFWAYKYNFQSSLFSYDGIRAYNYVWMSTSFFSSTNTGLTRINSETAVHETGHLMGLDDYYDYFSDIGQHSGLGGADMMDYNMGDHNPFSKMMLNWIHPDVFRFTGKDDKITVNLYPSETTGHFLIIAPQFQDTVLDEYFILDFYTFSGLTERLQYFYGRTPGVRMYQVNAVLDENNGEYVSIFKYDNSDAACKLIRYIEASGENQVEKAANKTLTSNALYRKGDSFGIKTWKDFSPYTSEYRNFRFSFKVNGITKDYANVTITINNTI